ncbi:MAG: hypothetical protein ACF8SC_03865 [Phycisphaerales bacterium JB037]
MNASDHGRFWDRYDREVRPAIERACRGASRTLTDHSMDADDMAAWVHQRVWKMLEKSAWPTFHDDPTIDKAIGRLVGNARTLARWAYLALSRRHWRRMEREQRYASEIGRTERLGMVRPDAPAPERAEEISTKLRQLRESLGESVRQRLAASWPEESEKHRIAMALGTDDAETEELIDRVRDGDIKVNTVQQMRSRSLRRARRIAENTGKLTALLVAGLVIALSASTARAGESGGERTGGRGGLSLPDDTVGGTLALGGERTGGRGGKGGKLTPLLAGGNDGERTGGRP